MDSDSKCLELGSRLQTLSLQVQGVRLNGFRARVTGLGLG